MQGPELPPVATTAATLAVVTRRAPLPPRVHLGVVHVYPLASTPRRAHDDGRAATLSAHTSSRCGRGQRALAHGAWGCRLV